MKRALSSGIVLLLAAIVAVAVITTTRRAEATTELLTLMANGLPDISHIQQTPATPAQIAAQMKKDGLKLDLFSAVRPLPPNPLELTLIFARCCLLCVQCVPLRSFCRFVVCCISALPAAAPLFAALPRLHRNSLVQFSCLLRSGKLTWK